MDSEVMQLLSEFAGEATQPESLLDTPKRIIAELKERRAREVANAEKGS